MNRIGLNCNQASGKETRLSPTQVVYKVSTQLGELHVAVFKFLQSQCLQLVAFNFEGLVLG